MGVVIFVSNKDDNNKPDNGPNKVEDTLPNGDNSNTQNPNTPANPDKNENQDNRPSGGGISIGENNDQNDNPSNNQNGEQNNSQNGEQNNNQNGEQNNNQGGSNTEKPVERCKHCNKPIVSKYDPRVNDLDNYCDGDCIGWLG